MTKMTRTKAIVAGAAGAALLLGAGVGAYAQNDGRTMGRPAAQRAFDPAAMKARMEARHAGRAAALHDLLKITPAQEGAWAAFQSATRPPARERDPAARQDRQSLTTPQRLDRLVERENQRHAQVLGRTAAVRQFYSQLSPEQKKTFDALPQPGHGREGRMGPGPRGGRGGVGHGAPFAPRGQQAG